MKSSLHAYRVGISHSMNVPSSCPVVIVLLSDENSNEFPQLVCPLSVFRYFPVAASHNRGVPPKLPICVVTSVLPSGEYSIQAFTGSSLEGFISFPIRPPLSTSHSCTVPLFLTVASVPPFGEYLTVWTWLGGPRVFFHFSFPRIVSKIQ